MENEDMILNENSGKPTDSPKIGFGKALTSVILGSIAFILAVLTLMLGSSFLQAGKNVGASGVANGNFGYQVKVSEDASENKVRQAVSDAVVLKCGYDPDIAVYNDSEKHEGYKVYLVVITYPKAEEEREQVGAKRSEIAEQIAANLNIAAENVEMSATSSENALIAAFAVALGYGFALGFLIILMFIFGLQSLPFSIIGLIFGINGIKRTSKLRADGVNATSPFVLSVVGTSLSGVSMLFLAISLILVIVA